VIPILISPDRLCPFERAISSSRCNMSSVSVRVICVEATAFLEFLAAGFASGAAPMKPSLYD